MVSNLFIDTDVLLDVVLDREEFFKESSAIFQKFENGELLLFTSSSTIINARYVGQKLIGKAQCRSVINYLLNYFIILDAGIDVIKKAYQSKFSDIEDAVQYYTAAKNGNIDFFITRNIRDFRYGDGILPIVTPAKYLKTLT